MRDILVCRRKLVIIAPFRGRKSRLDVLHIQGRTRR